MYPTRKDKDAVYGTPVFYQAMPAVAADGKNIMKLIPVQVVKKQVVQTPTSKPRTNPTPQKAVTANTTSVPIQVVDKVDLNPFVSQQVSFVTRLLNQAGLQQKTANLPPAENCGRSVKLSCQLPVIVKSPALPKGQYLQIPPDAQVRTVPGSELPASIKKHIFSSSATPSAGSGLPSVVYVSPITAVNQGVSSPGDSALSKTSRKTSCGPSSTGSKPHLKLVPKVSQRPNSPIKWVIEEDSSSAPELNPLHPPIAAQILRTVTERETAAKHSDLKKAGSQSSTGKSGQGQENALVMWNGKVFFVAGKSSPPLKTGATSTATTKSYEFNKTTEKSPVPSSHQPLQSVAPQTQQDVSIIIPDESNDVIDLCDDEESSQQAAPVTMSADPHLDEDNVIFVSYIPPKSKSESTNTEMQTAHGKETHQTKSTNGGTEVQSLGGDGQSKPSQSMLVSTGANVKCGSTVTDKHNNEDSDMLSQQNMEADVETDPSTSSSSSGACSQEGDGNKMENLPNPATCCTSSLAAKPCHLDDHLLRQTFRITADVKICLQRIIEAPDGSISSEPPQTESMSSVEDQQEPSRSLKETVLDLQEVYTSCENQAIDSYSGLSNVRLNEQELSTDPATPNTEVTPPKLKCSLEGTSCDDVTEPVIGYMEPIDEDFPSTDETNIYGSDDPEAQPQAQTCVALNSKMRRIGRKRKRTMCPCCSPGDLDPAVKSSTRFEESEKWTWNLDQTSKKGTKALRKDGKTSGNTSCLIARNRQKCKTYGVPHSLPRYCLSTVPEDSELKLNEQIKRLKDLLKEKEAALEQMRNSMS